MPTQSETDQKNTLVADQLMESMIQIHGRLRPFIVIFPDEGTGNVASITNITTVEAVSNILISYLNSMEDLEEMESVEEPVAN